MLFSSFGMKYRYFSGKARTVKGKMNRLVFLQSSSMVESVPCAGKHQKKDREGSFFPTCIDRTQQKKALSSLVQIPYRSLNVEDIQKNKRCMLFSRPILASAPGAIRHAPHT